MNGGAHSPISSYGMPGKVKGDEFECLYADSMGLSLQ